MYRSNCLLVVSMTLLQQVSLSNTPIDVLFNGSGLTELLTYWRNESG